MINGTNIACDDVQASDGTAGQDGGDGVRGKDNNEESPPLKEEEACKDEHFNYWVFKGAESTRRNVMNLYLLYENIALAFIRTFNLS